MRIISGKLKGRKLQVPKNLKLRPTTDFAKEGLFNLLKSQLELSDLKVLDLCCGTGSISFEFASRGVESVVSVDQNSNCLKQIQKQALQFELDNVFPYKADLFRYLKKTKLNFDLIFADPPYDLSGIENLPAMVASQNLLNQNGFFILEHSKKYDFTEESGFFLNRRYGNVNFTFFKTS